MEIGELYDYYLYGYDLHRQNIRKELIMNKQETITLNGKKYIEFDATK